MVKKLLAAAVAAVATFVMSAFRPIVANASYYASPSGDSTNTNNDPTEVLHETAGVLNDTTETVTGKSSRTSQSFGDTVKATLRRAVFTRDLEANNSISDGQVCLA